MTEVRYLLDSNILVYMLGGKPDRLRVRIEREAPQTMATSMICVAEVMVGVDRAAQRKLANLLKVISPLPFDLSAAESFAQVPFSRGRFDRLIAAHALSLNVTLVTANVRDFADVAELKVEDWTKAER